MGEDKKEDKEKTETAKGIAIGNSGDTWGGAKKIREIKFLNAPCGSLTKALVLTNEKEEQEDRQQKIHNLKNPYIKGTERNMQTA